MESPLYQAAPADLKVIETLRYDTGAAPGGGFCRLARHLDRAARTCARLRIAFNQGACEAALRAAVPRRTRESLRCRLTIDRAGRPEATAAPLPDTAAVWRVIVSATQLASDDPWLAVKTTERRLYDEARSALPPGVDESIFLNEAGEVCEGTITNVFARLSGQAGERLATPPLSCGLLPGVLRSELLETGVALERRLGLEDLHRAEALFVGNSLRGLIRAELI